MVEEKTPPNRAKERERAVAAKQAANKKVSSTIQFGSELGNEFKTRFEQMGKERQQKSLHGKLWAQRQKKVGKQWEKFSARLHNGDLYESFS